MPNPITRGFSNLTRFSGRDTRAQFWPYAALAFALYQVLGPVVLIPTVLPVLSGPNSSTATFLNAFIPFMVGSLLFFLAFVGLLAAAVARRLHDSGRTAIWGLLPLPFLAYSGTMFFRLFTQFRAGAPDTGLFFTSIFVSNLLYLVGLVALVVLLALRSTPGPNRFGDSA